MLKISKSIEFTTQPGEGVVRVDDDSKTECDGSKLDEIEISNNKVDDKGDNEVEKKSQKHLSKSQKTELGFLTSRARITFTKLTQMFIKAPILHHFDLERHIRIETDELGYTIGEVFSQLILDNLGQWHLVAFFLQKMIPTETRYE